MMQELFSHDTCASLRGSVFSVAVRGVWLAQSVGCGCRHQPDTDPPRGAWTGDKLGLSWLLLVGAADRKRQSHHPDWKPCLSGSTDTDSGTHTGRQHLQTQRDLFY